MTQDNIIMSEDSNELLELDPCPFCGGPAYALKHPGDVPDYYVYHDDKEQVDYDCPASTFSYGTRAVRKFRSMKAASNSWNCRSA